MGIWTRVRDIVRSRSHRELDGDELREEMDKTYRHQLTHLQTVRRGVADVSTSRKRVEVRLGQMRQQAADLDEEAAAAVSRGDDDAARAALGRKVTLEEALADLEQRHETLRQEEATITRTAEQLERSIEDFRMRKDTLSARQSAASARSQAIGAGRGIDNSLSQVNQQMESAERHTRELEAKADAVDELVAEGVISRPGETSDDAEARRFDALLNEGTTSDVGHEALEPGQEQREKGDGPQQISS